MHIVTLNVRGLSKIIKRRHFFESLTKYSISCLQECYITPENSDTWAREWSGEFIYQCGSSNPNHSKGLVILINKNFHFSELQEIKINDRCLGISFKTLDHLFVVFNIYAPSQKEERVPFIQNLPFDLKLNSFPENAFIILCGDFNMIMNNDLDILGGAPHPVQEIENFKNFISNHSLVDCFRKLNPLSREFSWSRTTDAWSDFPYFSARRLDYILCNKSLISYLKNCEMCHFSLTDHRAVAAFFKIDLFPRGPGRWQFNESLLDKDEFLNHMNNFLSIFISDLYSQEYLDKRMLWDLLMVGIKDECISFSRTLTLHKIDKNKLNSDINDLISQLLLRPNDPNLIKRHHYLLKEKEILDLSESKGALKRSRAHFIEAGEKNTKLFLGLEKGRQSNMVLRSVIDNNNSLIESPSLILQEIFNFYQSLMTETSNASEESHLNFLNNRMAGINHPILDEIDKAVLDSPLIKQELKEAVHDLNFDSSPGIDGLSTLFYLQFWDHLEKPLYDCFIESTNFQSLSLSQRRAILSLLPKSTDLDLNDLGNWRPISLTTTSYKIYSKVLANRLQTVINKLIHPNQAGFIKNRNISKHLRLLDDVINLCNKENIPGILASLDYRKAFDTVSKAAITAALQKFNFGPVFINYVKTLLNDTQACVKNAGWLSSWFNTSRGVRQGCCLSPLLFIMVVEFLAIKIRNDKEIIGTLDNLDPSFSQEDRCLSYADDMELLVKP